MKIYACGGFKFVEEVEQLVERAAEDAKKGR